MGRVGTGRTKENGRLGISKAFQSIPPKSKPMQTAQSIPNPSCWMLEIPLRKNIEDSVQVFTRQRMMFHTLGASPHSKQSQRSTTFWLKLILATQRNKSHKAEKLPSGRIWEVAIVIPTASRRPIPADPLHRASGSRSPIHRFWPLPCGSTLGIGVVTSHLTACSAGKNQRVSVEMTSCACCAI